MTESTELLLVTRTNKEADVKITSLKPHEQDDVLCNHFIDFVKEATGLLIKKTQVSRTNYSASCIVIALNEDGEEVAIASIFDDAGIGYDLEQTTYEHEGIVNTGHIKIILSSLVFSGHIPFLKSSAETDKDSFIPTIALFSCNQTTNNVAHAYGNDPLLFRLSKEQDANCMNLGSDNYNILIEDHEHFYSDLKESEQNLIKQVPAINNKYDTDQITLTGYFNKNGKQRIKPFKYVGEADIENTLLLEPKVIDALCSTLGVNFAFSKLSTSIALNYDIVYYEKRRIVDGAIPGIVEPNEHYGTVVDLNVLNGAGSFADTYEYMGDEFQEYILASIDYLLFRRDGYKKEIVLNNGNYLVADDAYIDGNLGYPVNIHKSVAEVVSVKSCSKANLGKFLFLLWDTVDPDDNDVEDICIAFYHEALDNLYSVAKINAKTKGLICVDIFDNRERALHHTIVEYSKKTGLTESQAKKLVDNAAMYYKSWNIAKSTKASEFFEIK